MDWIKISKRRFCPDFINMFKFLRRRDQTGRFSQKVIEIFHSAGEPVILHS